MTAISVVPPPMSITMLPVGVSTGRPTPIAAAIGSATMNTSLAPAVSAESRTARLSTSVMPDGTQTMTLRLHPEDVLVDDDLEEVAQHLLGDVEVGDDAVLHRPHGDDAVGRAAEHALGLEPDALDLARRLLDRDDRRLVEDDAFALHVDQRVGRAEVHRDLVRGKPGHQIQGRKLHRTAVRRMVEQGKWALDGIGKRAVATVRVLPNHPRRALVSGSASTARNVTRSTRATTIWAMRMPRVTSNASVPRLTSVIMSSPR